MRKITKEQINQMPNDELHREVAKILGDTPRERGLDYSNDWALAGEIVNKHVSKLFRNIGGTWTAVMKGNVEDGTMSGQPIFTSFADKSPTAAAVKCLILHNNNMVIQQDN